MVKTPGNSEKNKRVMPKGKPWKKGQSGNPSGRPKSTVSVTAWMRELLALSPVEAADQFDAYAQQLRAGGKAPFAPLIAVRVLMALVNEPDARMFREVLDRTEGKVPQVIKIWRDEIVELIQQGAVTADEVEAELGRELAVELFRAAGLEVK